MGADFSRAHTFVGYLSREWAGVGSPGVWRCKGVGTAHESLTPGSTCHVGALGFTGRWTGVFANSSPRTEMHFRPMKGPLSVPVLRGCAGASEEDTSEENAPSLQFQPSCWGGCGGGGEAGEDACRDLNASVTPAAM